LNVDVLCVGQASYDLTFAVPHHPEADEKTVATGLTECGGGPAANAALTVARLGRKAVFAGYLGRDTFGDRHVRELEKANVDCRLVLRGEAPTPLSVVMVKPDGRRSLVNYRASSPLPGDGVDCSGVRPRVILCDGHEPYLSLSLLARTGGTPAVLDAGSLHAGSRALMSRVDHLVCSEKFARQFSGQPDMRRALDVLADHAPCVVITLGADGLVWKRGGEHGALPAFRVDVVDTTGAGDAFHGAFAVALAEGQPWPRVLRFASATAALSCTGLGARACLPTRQDVDTLLSKESLTP